MRNKGRERESVRRRGRFFFGRNEEERKGKKPKLKGKETNTRRSAEKKMKKPEKVDRAKTENK